MQVKDNQPSLLRRLADIAATTAPIAIDDSRNLARNRQEDRSVAVYFPGSALDDTEWEPLVAAVVRVERNTLIRSAATGQWTTRQETAFYASSVMLPAKTFGQVRGLLDILIGVASFESFVLRPTSASYS